MKRRRGRRRPTPRDPDERDETAEDTFFRDEGDLSSEVRGLELAAASGMYATRRALF